jgi:hypothetical protein
MNKIYLTIINFVVLLVFTIYCNNAEAFLNSNWAYEVIETGNLYNIYPSHFCLDSKGSPHFIYGQNPTYAYFNGQSWIKKPLEINDYEVGLIALDNNDLPHIIYKQIDGIGLVHVYVAGGNWYSEKIFDDSVAVLTDFVIDSKNRLHVVFSKGNLEQAEFIGHLMGENGKWKLIHIAKTIMDSGVGYLSKSGKIALDDSNNLYAGFTEVTTGNGDKEYWRYKVKYKSFSEETQSWPEYSQTVYENIYVPIGFFKQNDNFIMLIETWLEAYYNSFSLIKNLIFCYSGNPEYPYFYYSGLGKYNDLFDQPVLKVDSKGSPHIFMFGNSEFYDIGHNILSHKTGLTKEMKPGLTWSNMQIYSGPFMFWFGDLHFDIDSLDRLHVSFIEGPPGTITKNRKLLPLNNCNLKYIHSK